MKRARAAPKLGVLAVALGCAAVARADPVLHEYVPEVRQDEATALVAGEGDEPAAIVYDGEVIPPPDGESRGEDEQAMGAPPSAGLSARDPGVQGPSFRPDRVTDLDGQLGYQTVFSPSIAPFKRVTALNAVRLDSDGETPVLAVRSGPAVPMVIEGASTGPPDDRPRDRFWGSVVLDFTGRDRVPFPSVSPESRILTLRTEPEVRLRIERNDAGAFFALPRAELPEDRIRVTFLTDAPRPYFNTSIPDVASDSLADRVPPLPERTRRQALRFARELGLRPGDPLEKVLSTLTAHFRAFEESAEPPDDSGQIFLDLARAQKGVCRHRSYGFVITAHALGIPARFVYNEAHSWVEVAMPQPGVSAGWMRIDLGGAAEGLERRGGDDGPAHRPAEPDPLPRPESYERSYSQAASAGRGGGGPASYAGADEGGGSQFVDADGAQGAPGQGQRFLNDPNAPAVEGPPPENEGLTPLSVSLERRQYEVFRGRALAVGGRVTESGGDGVQGLRVEVLLRGDDERLLGVTVTREHGWFRGNFGIPPDTDTGEYQLVVRTPGDEEHAPALAR